MDRNSGADDNDARGFPAVPEWNSGEQQKHRQLSGRLIGTMRYIWVRGPEATESSGPDQDRLVPLRMAPWR